MMAVAGWMVWERLPQKGFSVPLALFFVQLVLNTLWSVIFFGLRSPGWAFGEVVLLWISFATFLNFTIWRLNR
ncbi:MAG: tryptophan-rich sensory protein [Candidatus Omnitrophica bacterium]|nr:tryptophan-rich sensory protein [Candidatus Omnitrophota bacterium]